MPAISAVNAVSPAIQRTKEFLFKPFSWATYLKLGLVAIITEGSSGSLNSGSHNSSSSGSSSGHMPNFPGSFHLEPQWIALIAAAVLIAIVIGMVVAYLITRLRFAFFYCLIHNTRQIRPGWWLYSAQAARFFWLNVVVGFAFLLVLVGIALPFVSGFMRLYHERQQTGSLDVGLMLSLVLPLIPIFTLFLIAGVVTDIVLRDWMLPHIALDDATAGEAWAQVWARVRAEKQQFLAYVLLRLVLPVLAMIALFILLIVPGLVLAGSLAAVEFGLHSAFADAHGGEAFVGLMLEIFFGALAFGFALLASICLGGPISTAKREYALVFYGGRYQRLGETLYPAAMPLPPENGAARFA